MNITIYTKLNCPQCTQAKTLLDINSIPYEVVSLAERGESGEGYISREQLLDRFPSARTMPQIEINGAAIGGLEELKTILNKQSI
jgi:glutaredoxin 3